MALSLDRRTLLTGTLAASAIGAAGTARAKDAPRLLAPTPPMGWNSWNSFATTITEAQAIETATIMAEKLLPSGYDIFTVDIQWYEPGASSYTYATKPKPVMDDYGRLLPAPNRFPSMSAAAHPSNRKHPRRRRRRRQRTNMWPTPAMW